MNGSFNRFHNELLIATDIVAIKAAEIFREAYLKSLLSPLMNPT